MEHLASCHIVESRKIRKMDSANHSLARTMSLHHSTRLLEERPIDPTACPIANVREGQRTANELTYTFPLSSSKECPQSLSTSLHNSFCVFYQEKNKNKTMDSSSRLSSGTFLVTSLRKGYATYEEDYLDLDRIGISEISASKLICASQIQFQESPTLFRARWLSP